MKCHKSFPHLGGAKQLEGYLQPRVFPNAESMGISLPAAQFSGEKSPITKPPVKQFLLRASFVKKNRMLELKVLPFVLPSARKMREFFFNIY